MPRARVAVSNADALVLVAGAGRCDTAGPAPGTAWGRPGPGRAGVSAPFGGPRWSWHTARWGAWAAGLQCHQAAVCDNFLASPFGTGPAATARRGQVRGPRESGRPLLAGQGVTGDTETSFPLWPAAPFAGPEVPWPQRGHWGARTTERDVNISQDSSGCDRHKGLRSGPKDRRGRSRLCGD